MKDVELKLISELMKNCRRSDRELARVLGVSQPTVNRMIKKLEKNGYIKGYSAIPDFPKIGLNILAISFVKLRHPITAKKLEEGRNGVRQMLSKESAPAIIGMRGVGLDADRVLVTFHEDYVEYDNYLNFIEKQPLVEVEGVKSYLVNLKDKSQFLPPSLEYLAGYILRNQKLAKNKQLLT